MFMKEVYSCLKDAFLALLVEVVEVVEAVDEVDPLAWEDVEVAELRVIVDEAREE